MNKKVFNNYIKEIDMARYSEPSKMLKIARQILTESKKTDDEKSLVEGEYYYLEAMYRLGRLDQNMLNRAIHILQVSRRLQMYDLESRILNMMGIFFLNQEDNVSALEYYQMAMECAVKHRFKHRIRVVTNNIGDLYMHLKQYDEALVYLEKCYNQTVELYEEDFAKGKKRVSVMNINVALLNMAECYCVLGKHEASLKCLNSFYEDKEGIEASFYGPGRDALLIQNYAVLGRLDEVEDCIESVISAAETGMEIIEMAEQYAIVCQVLIKNDRMDQALRLQKAIKSIAEKLKTDAVLCSYYEIEILFAKRSGDKERLIYAYECYLDAKNKQEECFKRQQVQAVKNRQALKQALQKQKRAEEAKASLKHLSEHDPLTGLYNRYVLNRECQKWWHQALVNQTQVGTIVMDIDYFKQYNDFYGHLEGDECIRAVSDVVKETVGSKGIVVRYGGDEFFILLRGMSVDEVVEISRKINKNLASRNLLHEKSQTSDYVTVSQGIANGIPDEGQTVLDLTHLADNALYRAKEYRRGSIGVYEAGKYRVIEK